MLRNVNKVNGVFTAKDEMGREIFIHESISFLFLVEVFKHKVVYVPLTFRTSDVLEQVENYLRNHSCDKPMIENIVVRFGWMDKNLNSVEFIPLTDLVQKIRKNEASAKQRRKLTEICKQLSLSQRLILK